MTDFKQRVEEITKQIQTIKNEFEQYIADTNISLDERWDLFVKAPMALRNTSGWIERFEGLPEDFVMYDGYVYAERHQTVDVEHILEVAEDIVYNTDDCTIDSVTVSQINITAFKENVLKRNLYSFVYDW
jgi:hypothetical protein